MPTAQHLYDLFLAEAKHRLLEECIPRIHKCLDQLTEAEVWYRPNEHSNSVGNLVLHLCGNVTQWLGSGLGKLPDGRTRQAEFDERGPIPPDALRKKLDILTELITEVLGQVTAEQLSTIHPVQCYQETGLSIIVHVVEHFSYHTGQITYFVKAFKDMDMGYYAGADLEQKSN